MEKVNAWRNLVNGKRFYRMEVRDNGIYRLTYSELGSEVTSQNPQNFRMFRRGEEIAIHIEGESDGSFDTGDYIEFYGEPNDGETDRYLFRDTTELYNPYQPIYSKTAVYFLSIDVVNISTPPKRIETLNPDPSGASLVTEHWYTETYIKKDANDPSGNFDLRTSFSQGEAVDKNYTNRVHFQSTFEDVRSWSTYDTEYKKGLVKFQLDLNNYVLKSSVTLETRIINFSYRSARLIIKIGNKEEEEELVEKYKASPKFFIKINETEIDDVNSRIIIELKDDNDNPNETRTAHINQLGVMYFALTYPQVHLSIKNTDKKFFLKSGIKRKIAAPSSNSSNFYNINNPYSPRRYSKNNASSKYECIIASNTDKTEIYFSASSKSVSNLVKAQFDFTNTTLNYNYLIISHQELMKDEAVTSYANYRKSPTGGSNNVYTAEINKLYNTFSWGEYTPLAIRNTIDLLKDNNLKYVLLLGKGLDLDSDPYEKPPEFSPENPTAYHYIPSFGYPASDNAYSMYFNSEIIGEVSVGRIAAISSSNITDYLNKVKEHDQLDFDALWRKKALHLSGGSDAVQQQKFREVIDGFSSIFIDTLEGGIVETKSRTEDGVIEILDVSDIVDQGITLMTFYGHSSASAADIDIGPASNYNNKGKYPFVLMNGCGGGNLFEEKKSWGEDWIETPNKGAIGFMAKSGTGDADELKYLANNFYTSTFQDSIGASIGIHILNSFRDYLNNITNGLKLSTVEQFAIQGDPLIKISPNKPDFALNQNTITIIPQNNELNTSDDFYNLNIDIYNFGIAIPNQDLYVEITRRYSNGIISRENTVTKLPFNAPYNSNHTILNVLNSNEDKEYGSGNNEIIVTLGDSIDDQGHVISTIDEINLENNTVIINTYFYQNKVEIIYPQNQSVVYQNQIQIYAYDYSIDKINKNVSFQIANDSEFNSIIFEETVSSSQLFKWEIPLNNVNDTTVYYLRSSIINDNNSNKIWDTISFTKIKNNTLDGWMQSSIYQMQDNVLTNMTLNGYESNLNWSFPTDDAIIEVKSGGADYENGYTYEVTLNDETYVEIGGCSGTDRMIIMVFDQYSGNIKVAQKESWDGLRCGNGVIPGAVRFSTDDIRGKYGNPITRNGPYSLFIDPKYKMENIQPGDYVLTIMAGTFNFQKDLPNVGTPQRDAYELHLDALREAGLDVEDMQKEITKEGVPFVGWSRYKMTSNIPLQYYKYEKDKVIEETFKIQRNINEGKVSSSPIGPSKLFSRLWINYDKNENNIVSTKINGITKNPITGKLSYDSLYIINHEISDNGFDLSSIPSIQNYQMINLTMETSDISNNRIPAQLKNWRVSYSPIPEGVILKTDNLKKLTVQQGEPFSYNYEFFNVSPVTFEDSILIEINYKPLNNQFTDFKDSLYIASIPPYGKSNISITPITWNNSNQEKSFYGDSEISTNVNADFKINEIHYNNNFITESINITTDSTNPLIEIFFDGQRIINGDVISPNAEVNISLNDDNQYISLEDNFIFLNNGDTTSLLTALISEKDTKSEQYPLNISGVDIERVNNSNHITTTFNLSNAVPLIFLDENKNLKSGQYSLEISGIDPTGNNSGYNKNDGKANKLKVDFEINTEASITNFYPYPNPFSDNVKFVFQITGINVPDQIKIQIMTITGRVVKEIFQDELGPIRIGTNISEYAWDGKDTFGDQLANGVYLYRVIIPEKNIGNFKHKSTSSDNLFKQNIGKLYLLR
nr:C25 family cysteine peptidase [Flammeovirga pectinis]